MLNDLMVVTTDRTQLALGNKDFYQFLDSTQKNLKKIPNATQILSFAFSLPGLDPLHALETFALPGQEHFYWESRSQALAIAAIGHVAKVELQGKCRFVQSQFFIDRLLKRTAILGDESLPFAGPHFFCSFTFFDDSPPVQSPFPPATLFLPQWHLVRYQEQGILVINRSWQPRQSPYALCQEVWKAKTRIHHCLTAPFLANHNGANHNGANHNGANHNPVETRHSAGQEVLERQSFRATIQKTLEEIVQGSLSKVVLARALEVTATAPFQATTALENLRHLHPDCYLFSVGNGQGQTFLGASPERLIRIHNQRLQTEALAGSAPRGATTLEDESLAMTLLSSPKELYEHQVVVEFIMQQLQHLGLQPIQAACPSLLQLSNIQHLQTSIQAHVPLQVHPLEIVAQLHPTPAVAGVPRQRACDHIRRHEPFERSLYAAPLGWIDHQGNCEFIVGIRSALLEGSRACLFAGAGIVDGSDPDRELAEVELKLQTLLNVL
jgi:menaquinone-specific isochorismate synthase